MCDIGGDGFEADGLDPDALLWVRGVDYMTGWREASRAAAELGDALTAAGVEMAGAKLQAVSAGAGSGVVRLELSTAAAREVAIGAYIAGFQRAYETNRAPFFIGNHFEQWNGGIYMDAVEEALKHIADTKNKDVRLVSFRQLCDWLDAQDPKVLTDLRRLGVGQQFTGHG